MKKFAIVLAVEAVLYVLIYAYYQNYEKKLDSKKVTDFITFKHIESMKLARNDRYNSKDYKEDFLKTYKDSQNKDLILYPNSREISSDDLQNLQDEDLLLAPPKPKEKEPSELLKDETSRNEKWKGLYKYPTPDEWNRGIPYLNDDPAIMDMRRFHGN
ncbi:hypothetical protein DCO58_07690 [Helicobacter saguini]|uniref:Uncharacterized protein n=1 Tax=Helicobacter saguini TaxID=1548018 RepID=A0A347VNF7_9HELI|nr:hypothetical protein [Helicobacter saguini]MWV61786.1 hypothetical protein [Helicobacter saguini]MWV67539.1 hypothetical protein [Helicobacter saguini]MWV69890.1 hypothetical protein [Helicobacter saguini]MWV72893.1 hypothetical protein [Helicobacter saguini]TLD93246.1 hypothetical protein LS64_009025 [Helicobacter saguini]